MPLVGKSAHGMFCRTKGMAEIFQLHFVLGQNLLKYKSAVCWRTETAVDWTWMAFISQEDPTERGACSDNHIVGFFWLKEKKIKSLLTYLRGLFYGQRHGSNRTTLASATTERNISKTKYKCFWAPAGVHSNDTSWWYETICSDNSVVGVLLFKCRNLFEKKILISCQHPFLFVLHLFAS